VLEWQVGGESGGHYELLAHTGLILLLGKERRSTGMIPAASVARLVQAVQAHITANGLPWAAVHVWGFADSPVSWTGKDHGYLAGGDNDYTLLLLPHGRAVTFTCVGTHDRHQ